MSKGQRPRGATPLVIRDMQIKITMRYHLTSVKMTIMKKYTINAGKEVERRQAFYAVGGNVHWYTHYE